MREILFRGKRVDNGEWVYGDLAHSTRSANGRKPHISWIVDGYFSNGGWLTPLTRHAVIDKTVGEYTDFKDRNGNEIFEGDILAIDNSCLVLAYKLVYVIWSQGMWAIYPTTYDLRVRPIALDLYYYNNDSRIIGNIYDNPELLKGEQT